MMEDAERLAEQIVTLKSDNKRLAEQVAALTKDIDTEKLSALEWAGKCQAVERDLVARTAERDELREEIHERSNKEMRMIGELTKERDEKVLLNSQLADYLGETEENLAAAQARLKELSSVLEGVEIPFNLHEKIRYLLRETP